MDPGIIDQISQYSQVGSLPVAGILAWMLFRVNSRLEKIQDQQSEIILKVARRGNRALRNNTQAINNNTAVVKQITAQRTVAPAANHSHAPV